ncbi:hypothetical protein Csa_018884 [Cucumis sativus]|uniref:Uncharacterized protein n=1 Tax=Cucumis sativus TaxID=3659 RepID=A0A0A0KWJ8_CUCSA|nr:hypothetical protein Csa_018884 [Cucumis sativus]
MWRWIRDGCWSKGGWAACFECEPINAHGWTDEGVETDWCGCNCRAESSWAAGRWAIG